MIYNYRSNDIVQYCLCKSMDNIVEDIVCEYAALRRYDLIYVYASLDTAYNIVGSLINMIDGLVFDLDNDIFSEDVGDMLLVISYDGTATLETAHTIDNRLRRPDGVINYVEDGVDDDGLSEYGKPVLRFKINEGLRT